MATLDPCAILGWPHLWNVQCKPSYFVATTSYFSCLYLALDAPFNPCPLTISASLLPSSPRFIYFPNLAIFHSTTKSPNTLNPCLPI